MGGEKVSPLDFAMLNYLQIDLLLLNHSEAAAPSVFTKSESTTIILPGSLLLISILEVILGVFAMPATIMPCKFLFKQMHLLYFSLIERCCAPQNEAFNTK